MTPLPPTSVDNLKSDLKNLEPEVTEALEQISISNTENQDSLIDFFNTIVSKAADVFSVYIEKQNDTERYAIDKESETELKKMAFIERIDKRNSQRQLILVVVSIVVLITLSIWGKLSEGSVALLAIVISTALRENIKDLFGDIYNGLRGNNNNN